MATNTVKRQVRGTQRTARRAVAAGAVGAATLSALLLPATTAQAQPVTVPGVGTFEVPDQVQLPAGIPGVPESLPIQIPAIPGIETPGAPAPFAAPQKSAGDLAVDAALSKVGAPYVYGASGPNAFDCSGLVQWSYAQAGVDLPRTSYDQLATGTPVSADALQPGDIVSFYGGGHSGLYVGNGEVVHASTSGQPVQVAPISSMPFAGARRI
ncbi:C40 family peptidase [Nocardia sp. NPDC050406]|uniref:C40 family peptidase n=1 Tax=Nocardia sp. NPDC050406 TaxID=3364318 RepID=UPI0037A42A48